MGLHFESQSGVDPWKRCITIKIHLFGCSSELDKMVQHGMDLS